VTERGYKLPPLTHKDRLLQFWNKALHTKNWLELGMAIVETPNKVILTVCGFSAVSGLVLDVSLHSKIGAIITGLACFVFLWEFAPLD
jgi:hypothetical protein